MFVLKHVWVDPVDRMQVVRVDARVNAVLPEDRRGYLNVKEVTFYGSIGQ